VAETLKDSERVEIAKKLGALPVVKKLLQKLCVREIVDKHCPIRECADYTHGQIAEIFIANRLTAPHPLFRFDLWAEEFAVAELFGVSADKLNDDRLARTLDALSRCIDEIQIEIVERAVTVFGLSLRQAHLDITSLMFEGAYADGDPDFPLVKRGYNADKDFKRRQIKTGQVVLKDGNVPIFHKVFDGNRTDSNTLMQVFEGLEFLRAKAKVKEMVHVGDTKLLSAGNMLFLLSQDVLFVGPGERGKEFTEEILGLDPDKWTELQYASESELLKRKNAPEEEWNRYWYQEASASIEDPKSGKKFPYRRLIIRSSDEMRATQKNRERNLTKTEEDLTKLANGIPRYYKTKLDVEKKISSILETRRVKGLIKIEVGTREVLAEQKKRARTGAVEGPNLVPTVTWSRDLNAIAQAEKSSGCYPLLTNLPAERSALEVLTIQKDQYRVEHRFANWKGPLAVCPIFLHNNDRIAALVLVTALALMVFSLIEREVRRELGDDNGYAVGFTGERRKSRPTGTTIFYVLRVVTALVFQGAPRIHRVFNTPPLVQQIHKIFEVKIADIVS
jgi:transposase